MIDYTWLRLPGGRAHAYPSAKEPGYPMTHSLCGHIQRPAKEEPQGKQQKRCGNCERVLARMVAAEARASAYDDAQELDALAARFGPPGMPTHVELPPEPPPVFLSPEVLARHRCARIDPLRVNRVVAARVSVREMRSELKAIEEGVSRRFAILYQKLDALEQFTQQEFEALQKEGE